MKLSYSFAVVGRNITYSRSPDIFDAIFEVDGTSGDVHIINIEPDNFQSEFIHILADRKFLGLSITIPYKEAVIKYLDEIDKVAMTIGAVNSVAIGKKKSVGHNTDCYGFVYPLKTYRESLKDGSALVVGYGGAARAVVYSLFTDLRLCSVDIVGRDREKLALFKEAIRQILPEKDISIIGTQDLTALHSKTRYDIIINCTPLGGWHYRDRSPLPDGFSWPSGAIYYDLNYNVDNKIITEAKKAGLTTFDGMPMLIAQAVRSYELWTGRTVAVDDVISLVLSQD